MMKVCIRCGATYSTEDKRRRYCGVPCYRERQREAPNAGAFPVGLEPWNKGIKGLHLSPGSEFKAGRTSNNRVPVGSIKHRWRRREGYPRAWVKVAEPNKWRPRAVVEWERARGPLPSGLVIHHADRDPLNDAPGNLVALSRSAHINEHRLPLATGPAPKQATLLESAPLRR